jgi:hypothetical protein
VVADKVVTRLIQIQIRGGNPWELFLLPFFCNQATHLLKVPGEAYCLSELQLVVHVQT